ncbi:MAG: hypothetical protein K2M75_05095, partial [Clostridia bacterium]|nr:hypothetical protein [Clostridia bacterium]
MNLSKKKSRLLGLISVILILLVACSFVFAGQSNMMACAGKVNPTNQTDIISIGELLSTDRGNDAKEVGDKSIFDFNNLTALFNALTGQTDATLDDVKAEMDDAQYNDGKFGDKTYVPNTSTNGYSNARVASIHYGMNAEDIRNKTGGKNIDVVFGGHIWEVVTLTTTGQAGNTADDMKAGDVVLTLMLKDPIAGYKTKWNDWKSNPNAFDEKYTSTFYSASKIRSILLNGRDSAGKEVKYSTSANGAFTSLTSGQIPNYNTEWAIFTNSTVDKHVTNFLVKPKDVLYMQDENFYDLLVINSSSYEWGSGQNDASKNKMPSSLGTPTPTNAYSVNRWFDQYDNSINVHYEQEKSAIGTAMGSNAKYYDGDPLYFDWGNDYLWLPSWSEVGQDGTGSGITGLWALNTAQRKYNVGTTASHAWLRTGSITLANDIFAISETGGRESDSVNLSELAVRPALNLNLSAAADSTAPKLATPTDVEVEYTGSELDLDFAKTQGAANWWTNSFKDRVDASYYLGQVPGDPKEPGTYTVKLNLKDAINDSWADGTKQEKTIEFEVIKRKLSFPKWDTTNGGAKSFRGSAGVTFDLYYDGDYLANLHTLTGKDYFDLVDVTTPTGVNKQNKGWKYNAVDAKKYELTFTIKDTDHYQWKAPSDGKLPFEVTKKIINVTLTADDGITDSLTGREGNSVNAVLTIPPNQIEVGYDAKITISAQRLHAAPS